MLLAGLGQFSEWSLGLDQAMSEKEEDNDMADGDLTNWNYLVSNFDDDAAFEASTSTSEHATANRPHRPLEESSIFRLEDTRAGHGAASSHPVDDDLDRKLPAAAPTSSSASATVTSALNMPMMMYRDLMRNSSASGAAAAAQWIDSTSTTAARRPAYEDAASTHAYHNPQHALSSHTQPAPSSATALPWRNDPSFLPAQQLQLLDHMAGNAMRSSVGSSNPQLASIPQQAQPPQPPSNVPTLGLSSQLSAFAGGVPRSDWDPMSQPLRQDQESATAMLFPARRHSDIQHAAHSWILGQHQHRHSEPHASAEITATAPHSAPYNPMATLPSDASASTLLSRNESLPYANRPSEELWAERLSAPQAGDTQEFGSVDDVPSLDAASASASRNIAAQGTAKASKAKPRPRKKAAKSKETKPQGDRPVLLKPMSAYNYYFRDERYNIMKWRGEGLPPPVSDWSEEKQRALLYEHWFLDPVKGRRLHRKTEGKLGFTELSSEISQRWRDLSIPGREFYRNVALVDCQRYQQELAAEALAAPQQQQAQPSDVAQQEPLLPVEEGSSSNLDRETAAVAPAPNDAIPSVSQRSMGDGYGQGDDEYVPDSDETESM